MKRSGGHRIPGLNCCGQGRMCYRWSKRYCGLRGGRAEGSSPVLCCYPCLVVSPSLEVFEARSDGALGSLVYCLSWWLVALPVVGAGSRWS